MNLFIFLIVAVIFIALSISVILLSLLRPDKTAVDHAEQEQQRQTENIATLKQQLTELERKLASKDISQVEYDYYKLDAERRLLNSLPASITLSNQTPLGIIIGICIGLPIVAALLYIGIGTPTALSKSRSVTVNQSAPAVASAESAVNEVKQRLRINPDDIEALFALGNIYSTQQNFASARDIFKALFNRQPDRPDFLLAYAESQARMQNNLFEGLPLKLVKRTLQLDPQHKKANWLLGIALFQQRDAKGAIAIWQKQLERSDNSSAERAMLERMITQASGTPNLAAQETVQPPRLNLSVSISEALKGQYQPEDSVFIYAKATAGPPMPLAIYRTTADKLPLSVTLTDADAMTPQATLSMFTDIIAYARIAKSGDAITEAGDLLGKSALINHFDQEVLIEINTVVP